MKFDGTTLGVSFNDLADHSGSFGGGVIVSPYGNGAAMYTTVMTANLRKYGPGTMARGSTVAMLSSIIV